MANDLYLLVSSAMYRALCNDYHEVVYGWPAEKAAVDMLDCDDALEGHTVEEVVPLIERWRKEYPRGG